MKLKTTKSGGAENYKTGKAKIARVAAVWETAHRAQHAAPLQESVVRARPSWSVRGAKNWRAAPPQGKRCYGSGELAEGAGTSRLPWSTGLIRG